MDAIAGAMVISMSPMQFSVKMVAASHAELNQLSDELQKQYPFISAVEPLGSCPIDISNLVTMEMRVILDEDADYQQLCQLRADLNTRPAA